MRLAPPPPKPVSSVLAERFGDFVAAHGHIADMTFGSFRAAFRRPFELPAIIEQLESLGVASIGIVAITSIFIGMVMAMQFAYSLEKFGSMDYVGRVIGVSFARELAPTFTSVIVGGRIGAGMAAELGSMAVNEQVDAIRALGADPLKKLVWPRIAAATIAMPVLSLLALVLGFGGAMLIADMSLGIPAAFFFRSALDSTRMADFLSGMLKTPFFGAMIGMIGCHFGITTTGGTAGVGRATTRSVAVIATAILVANLFLTKLTILVLG